MLRDILLPIVTTLIVLLQSISQPSNVIIDKVTEDKSSANQQQGPSLALDAKITKGEWEYIPAVGGIRDLVLDSESIWATTSGGLIQWEQSTGEMTHYSTHTSSIPSNNLNQILSTNGLLYMSSDIGIIIFDKSEHWDLLPEAQIGLDLNRYAPLIIHDNALWTASADSISKKSVNESAAEWVVAPIGIDELKGKEIERFVEQDGELFAIVTMGPSLDDERKTIQLENGSWILVERPDVKSYIDSSNTWWMTNRITLYSSANQGSDWVESYRDPSLGLLSLHLIDEKDQLWISQGANILVLKQSKLIKSYNYTGPELNFINILEFDDAGRLWIATDGRGLTMFDGSQWHNWQPQNSGMREDAIRGMKVGNGKVYAGTFSGAASGGVNIYDIENDSWTSYWPEESELSGGGVGGIAIHPDGQVFMPTSARKLDILQGDTWEHIDIPIPEEWMLTTKDGLFDKEGNYWMLTDTGTLGVWKYDGNNWFYYGIPGSLSAMTMDPLGRLWIAGQIGVIVRDENEVWHLFSPNDFPFEEGWVKDVAIDAQNRAWFISMANIVVFNGTDYQTFPPTVIGESNWGGSLTFDNQGRLWAASSNGLAIFSGTVDLPPGGKITMKATDSVSEEEISQLMK